MRMSLALSLALSWGAPATPAAASIDYDIVYVRQPRFGDTTNTTWPEVAHPARLDPGADLMLLHPDGSEELLVAGGDGAITDPFVSFDGGSVNYAYFHDVRPQAINSQRGVPTLGADLFRIDLATRAITQLTFGEFTPNTGAGNFDESHPLNPGSSYDRLGYGILNLGPAPLVGGRIAFTSNRNGFVPLHVPRSTYPGALHAPLHRDRSRQRPDPGQRRRRGRARGVRPERPLSPGTRR